MIEIGLGLVLIPFLGIWNDKYSFPRYYDFFFPIYFLQHIHTWVSACAYVRLLFSTAHAFNVAHMSSSGASQQLCFRGNAWLRRWVETARGLGEISSRRQSLVMTQMKYEGIVRERAERKHEGSSLIPASFYDGYVSSLALWLSRRWRVASVCFRGARWDVTVRRTPRTSSQLYPLILRFYQPDSASPSHGIFIQLPAHKSPAAVKPDGRHTSWALPVTNRKWPACHVHQSCPLACAGN